MLFKQKLLFFKSGRWDIETNSDVLIRLPKENLSESVDLFTKILKDDQFKDKKLIDLRQNNQLIVNE